MVAFVKLGGSLITDKTRPYTVRHAILERLAGEIAAACTELPDMRLVVGHGSGSFGHVAAEASGFDPARGYSDVESFARVGAAAGELNAIVRRALVDAGVPAVTLPASTLVVARRDDRKIEGMDVDVFERVLAWGGVPLTYGDVVLTSTGGTIISTETIFAYLARHLQPDRIVLLSEVEGVYAQNPHVRWGDEPPPLLREITPTTWPRMRAGLAGARGADVTGGMVTKVAQMVALLEELPTLEILIASGLEHGLLHRALSGHDVEGTRIHRWPRGSIPG